MHTLHFIPRIPILTVVALEVMLGSVFIYHPLPLPPSSSPSPPPLLLLSVQPVVSTAPQSSTPSVTSVHSPLTSQAETATTKPLQVWVSLEQQDCLGLSLSLLSLSLPLLSLSLSRCPASLFHLHKTRSHWSTLPSIRSMSPTHTHTHTHSLSAPDTLRTSRRTATTSPPCRPQIR